MMDDLKQLGCVTLFLGGIVGVVWGLTQFFTDGQSLLILGGLVIFGALVFALLLMRHARQGHKNTRVLPPTDLDDLPEQLQPIASDLKQLGFTPQVTLALRFLVFQETIYSYVNARRNIFASARPENDGYATFTTYLSDGFAVLTQYKKDVFSSSTKLSSRVVEKSLRATLDAHKQHVREHIPAHGKPKSFSNYRQMMRWEDAQQYQSEVGQNVVQDSVIVLLRGLIALAILTMVTTFLFVIPVAWLIAQYAPGAFNELTLGIVGSVTASLIVGGTTWWAPRPFRGAADSMDGSPQG